MKLVVLRGNDGGGGQDRQSHEGDGGGGARHGCGLEVDEVGDVVIRYDRPLGLFLVWEARGEKWRLKVGARGLLLQKTLQCDLSCESASSLRRYSCRFQIALPKKFECSVPKIPSTSSTRSHSRRSHSTDARDGFEAHHQGVTGTCYEVSEVIRAPDRTRDET